MSGTSMGNLDNPARTESGQKTWDSRTEEEVVGRELKEGEIIDYGTIALSTEERWHVELLQDERIKKHNNAQDAIRKAETKAISDAAQVVKDEERRAERIWWFRAKSGVPKEFIHCTLDNYIDHGKSAQFKESIRGKQLPGAILCGGIGTGKTHFACAIISNMNKHDVRSVYIELVKLCREIKETWKCKDTYESDVIRKYGKEIPVLAIDEIGVQFRSDTEKQYLTEIINDRYNNNLITYLITNMTYDETYNFLGDRIMDRFKSTGRVLVFDWESYRGVGTRFSQT